MKTKSCSWPDSVVHKDWTVGCTPGKTQPSKFTAINPIGFFSKCWLLCEKRHSPFRELEAYIQETWQTLWYQHFMGSNCCGCSRNGHRKVIVNNKFRKDLLHCRCSINERQTIPHKLFETFPYSFSAFRRPLSLAEVWMKTRKLLRLFTRFKSFKFAPQLAEACNEL